MSRTAFALTCALLLCACPGAWAQRNLATNPGFEDGLRNWRFWGGGAPGEVLLETEDVHAGAGALRLTNPSAGKVRAYQGTVQLDQVEPRPLRLSYWCKRLSPDPKALQCIDLYGKYADGAGIGFFVNTSVEHVGEWVFYEHTFEPEKPVASLAVWPLNFDATEDVLFDDIVFTAEATPTDPARELLVLEGGGLRMRFIEAGGRVQVRDMSRTDPGARTYLDAPDEIGANTNLWSAELLGADGQHITVLPDARAKLTATCHETADGAREAVISWRGVMVDDVPTLDVEARVLVPAGEAFAHFTATASFADDTWGLEELRYPVLAAMPPLGERADDDFVAYPHGLGRLVQNPYQNMSALNLVYGSWSQTIQMLAWYDAAGGLYFSTADGEGYIKALHMSSEIAGGLRYSVGQFPADTGRPGLSYSSPYPTVVGPFAGDWYDAARIYRRWALAQEWCAVGSLAERTDVPAPVTDTSVWMIGSIARDRSDGRPYPQLTLQQRREHADEWLRAAYPPLAVDANADRARDFADYFGVPATWWWSTWMLPGFDVNHGRFTTPRAFEETVAAVAKLGVPVMPYMNIRRFDVGLAEWEEDPSLRAAAVITREGKPYLEAITGGHTAVMCRASEKWQERFAERGARLVSAGCAGLYLDELGTAASRPCYATDHGHPEGAGSHWIQGQREMLRLLRERCRAINPDFFTGGEEPAESYIDLNDYCFTYGSRMPDQIPLWQAVYHDYTVCVGRAVGKWYVPYSQITNYPEDRQPGDVRRDEFVTSMGQALVLGMQPGWVRPDMPTYAPLTAEYYRRLVQTYHHAKPWLLYGDMLREPRITTELPVVHSDWLYKEIMAVELPAVLCSAWRAPDDTLGLVFANVSEVEQSIDFSLSPGDYAFLPGTELSVARLADGDWQALPGRTLGGEPWPLTVPAEGFAALRLAAR